ncbi:hypothetical protein K3G39_07125 [Pontibacter sp. HSC-14F20]|uniref:hypothetical protein n=1 Tax=Pontibacter sp. HSC-14F20 TaxID=2864136 RepID=UPI001C732F78|nr:hypothetical protein [Pontibacter sp. HSC-14F20]MBX0333006.1 hypothetical protein [Pontibacter sp. HSC-14F20]
MSQQELFDKLSTLLAPAGYYMKLVGNWCDGSVLFNVRNADIFAHAFTYENLVESVAENLAYLQERIEDGDEELEESDFSFQYTLQAALETFSEEERTTVISYIFNQHLFDFLKEKLAADNIDVTLEPRADDERYSCVLFDVKLPHLQFRVFPIYGRCFDPEGVEREVHWMAQDREYVRHGNTPEYVKALQAIDRGLQEYCENILIDKAKELIGNTL